MTYTPPGHREGNTQELGMAGRPFQGMAISANPYIEPWSSLQRHSPNIDQRRIEVRAAICLELDNARRLQSSRL